MAGYSGATTVSAGVAAPSTDPLELPRVTVRPRDTGASLDRRLRKAGALAPVMRPVGIRR
jgi:hypothetical protein